MASAAGLGPRSTASKWRQEPGSQLVMLMVLGTLTLLMRSMVPAAAWDPVVQAAPPAVREKAAAAPGSKATRRSAAQDWRVSQAPQAAATVGRAVHRPDPFCR